MNRSSDVRQHKSFPFQVKALDDEQGLIEAYGSVFDNVDMGDDVVKSGAFKRTIQNSKSRVQAGKAKFLAMMLWNHDAATPIGGWSELKEDTHGLLCKGQIILSTQAGKEAYELIKAGVIQEFSIGYEIMDGGANRDAKTGYRNLTELRLWEVSPVTFAMNDEALLVGVKSIEHKSVHGDTALPIGARDATWDGPAAKKQIFSYAEDGDSFDVSKLKKCFLQQDGDPQTKGSWGYPFVDIVAGSPQINVAGVKACAGALSGSRGASTSGGDIDGMKAKVATMYHRINKKYSDADPLIPPWESDGKMNIPKQQKNLMEHYQDEMCQDLLEDWQDVYLCSLTMAIFDAFTIGDTPETDIGQALDDFKQLIASKFVPQAIECNLSQYIADNSMSYSPASRTMQNGSSSSYGWMSRSTDMQRKGGRAISAANQQAIDEHVTGIKAMAKEHMKAIHTAADDFATVIQGAIQPYDGDDPGKPADGEQEGKSRTLASPDVYGGNAEADELVKALASLKLLRK